MAEWSTYNGTALTYGGQMLSPVDTYNPLGVPPYTIRVKGRGGSPGTMWVKDADYITLVDAEENIWDITKVNSDWSRLLGPYSHNTWAVEIIGANTRGVTNMYKLCYACEYLEKTCLFDITGLSELHDIFWGTKIQHLPMFDTSHITSFYSAFANCEYLLDVPCLDTSKVVDMRHAFDSCISLRSLPLFNTSSVVNMQYAFSHMDLLEELPRFNTENVTNMSYMVTKDVSLQSLPQLNTRKVLNMNCMMLECTGLREVPLLDTSSVESVDRMLQGCLNVETGALALYRQMSTQATPPASHTDTFLNCGINSQSGRAELEQIPQSWGGLAPD